MQFSIFSFILFHTRPIFQPQKVWGKYLDGNGHQLLFFIHVEQTESRSHLESIALVLSHWNSFQHLGIKDEDVAILYPKKRKRGEKLPTIKLKRVFKVHR